MCVCLSVLECVSVRKKKERDFDFDVSWETYFERLVCLNSNGGSRYFFNEKSIHLAHRLFLQKFGVIFLGPFFSISL